MSRRSTPPITILVPHACGEKGDHVLELNISTPAREALVDITALVEEAALAAVPRRTGKAFRGLVHIYVPHTTAAVTVNEGADPSVARDILDTLARLVPHEGGYRHREGNADAHVKATLVGSHATIPLEDGHLKLGTWQSVYFAEFDGPRRRRIWLDLVASALDEPTV